LTFLSNFCGRYAPGVQLRRLIYINLSLFNLTHLTHIQTPQLIPSCSSHRSEWEYAITGFSTSPYLYLPNITHPIKTHRTPAPSRSSPSYEPLEIPAPYPTSYLPSQNSVASAPSSSLPNPHFQTKPSNPTIISPCYKEDPRSIHARKQCHKVTHSCHHIPHHHIPIINQLPRGHPIIAISLNPPSPPPPQIQSSDIQTLIKTRTVCLTIGPRP
jgi:hypothetical protein